MKLTKRVRAASDAFLAEIAPDVRWDLLGIDAIGREMSHVKSCVEVAFMAYAAEWPESHIRGWQWPITTWQGGKPFTGSEPWTILLGYVRAALAEARRGKLVRAKGGR